jgi:hypothetical protein
MALDTYAGLQAEVADWLDRADLTSKIPTFIRLFEAQAERKLRVRQMLVANQTGTLDSSGFITLPDGFLALQNFAVYDAAGLPTPLTYASKAQCDQRRHDLVTTKLPTVYTLNSTSIEMAPRPDAAYAYELSYWSKLPKLGTYVSSNWLLADHPDLYLYGTLLQAEPYLKHDERIDIWAGALSTLMEDITLADEKAMRPSGTPLKTRMRAYG